MWNFPRLLAASVVATFVMAHATAAVFYVDVNCPDPQPPYADWSTAATNIQDAIDAANGGDLVLVTNGVYQTGGRVVYGALTNRVAVTKPLTLQSVNGPEATFILGNIQVYFPSTNLRCVYLTNGAVLSGFTLTNGGTLIYSSATEDDGAGVWCESTTALISNCVVTGCSGSGHGGGAYSGTLANCTLKGNYASLGGGGAYSGSLINCTLTENHAGGGGGAYNAMLINCTLSYNVAYQGAGAVSATLTNCVLYGNSAGTLGGGVASSTLSGCVLSNNYANAGAGCIWSYLEDCTITANVAAHAGGGAGADCQLWNCIVSGNSVTATNGQGGGLSSPTAATGCLIVSNSAASQGGGTYFANLTNCVLAWNVCSNSGAGAFNGVLEGCTLSNNYAYGSGGGSSGSTLSHCTVQANVATGGAGVADGTVRGSVVVSNYSNSTAGGLGACSATDCLIIGNLGTDGAGVWGGNITNCLLAYNRAERVYYPRGGAANNAILDHCIIATNFASEGAGVRSSFVYNSVLIGNVGSWGGGAAYSTLDHCAVGANLGYGAGAGGCSLTGCLITNNIGVGVLGCSVNSCTVAGNVEGAEGGTLVNSVVYGNSDSNWEFDSYYGLHFTSSCTDPIPTNYTTTFSSMSAVDTFTNDPVFVNPAAGDYRLQPSSPCINSGNNSYVTASTDFDGSPRIKGGTVDIGAYEFQNPTSTISYVWLRQFNLPTDGSADFTDPDGDHMNNWQEWRAGTDPTNPLSFLKMLQPTATNTSAIVISWQSVSNRTYFLQRATNLSPPTTFSTIQSNIPGLPNTTSYTDTNALGPGPFFYRIGVQ